MRTPSPERCAAPAAGAAGAEEVPGAAGAAGVPRRKPRPRAARHREIHSRVAWRLHSSLQMLAERAEDGATTYPQDALGGCIAAVDEAKTLARRFSTNARELSETLQREAVRAEVRIAEELERAVARAAARAAAARAPEGPLAAAEAAAEAAATAEAVVVAVAVVDSVGAESAAEL